MATVLPFDPQVRAAAHPRDVEALIDLRPLSALQWRVFALCALVLFIDGYDMQALALTVPDMAADWGIAPPAFSLALSASLLGMAIGGAAFAPLGDRFGRKPMLIAAMLAMGLSTLAVIPATAPLWVAGCRVVTGIALGIAGVNAAAISGEYAPAGRRFLIMTVLTCFVPLGAFSAAMTAPAVIAALSWHGIFIVGGAVPLLVALAWLLAGSESIKWLVATRPGDARIPAIGDALAAPAEALVSPVARDAPARRSVLGLLQREHRVRTLVIWLSGISGSFCLYLMVSWLPTVLREAGWSQPQAMWGAAAVQLGGIGGSLAMSWLIDRRHLLGALLGGYAGAAVALLAIGLLPGSVTSWLALLLLVGAGTSGMQAVFMAISVALYPLELRATSAGWVSAVSRIGAVSAPFAGGAAIHAAIEPRFMLLALVVPIGLSATAVLLARRHFVPPRAAGEMS